MATAATGCAPTAGQSGVAGGTDSQGFPVDANGNVSTNPNDYRAILCASPEGQQAPDYQQECVDKGYGN